jgi:hypothetical protein
MEQTVIECMRQDFNDLGSVYVPVDLTLQRYVIKEFAAKYLTSLYIRTGRIPVAGRLPDRLRGYFTYYSPMYPDYEYEIFLLGECTRISPDNYVTCDDIIRARTPATAEFRSTLGRRPEPRTGIERTHEHVAREEERINRELAARSNLSAAQIELLRQQHAREIELHRAEEARANYELDRQRYLFAPEQGMPERTSRFIPEMTERRTQRPLTLNTEALRRAWSTHFVNREPSSEPDVLPVTDVELTPEQTKLFADYGYTDVYKCGDVWYGFFRNELTASAVDQHRCERE